MVLQQRIDALVKLGEYIRSKPELLNAHVERTKFHNGWFTNQEQWKMLHAIAESYLDREKLEHWVTSYCQNTNEKPQTIGLILAGNIPLVGFHDWLCVAVSGHKAKMKLSSKDPFVLPHLISELVKIEPQFDGYFEFVEHLKDFDAVIATGSDTSSKYFEKYFSSCPHIIRKNRSSVAIIEGDETQEDLHAIACDIFDYYGLGCRSIGKIYVPKEYDFEPFLEVCHSFKAMANHSKWKNNYDYNFAIFSVNRVPFLMTGPLLLVEQNDLQSRLATLHYEFYDDVKELENKLVAVKDQLQVVSTKLNIQNLPVVPFGQAQKPSLLDYADGVDTLQFLKNLN